MMSLIVCHIYINYTINQSEIMINMTFKIVNVKSNKLVIYSNLELIYYFYLVFSCYGVPIFGMDSSFPFKADCGLSTTFLMFVIHPKACHVVTSFGSCKCKLTVSNIFILVKIISIRGCHLRKKKEEKKSNYIKRVGQYLYFESLSQLKPYFTIFGFKNKEEIYKSSLAPNLRRIYNWACE